MMDSSSLLPPLAPPSHEIPLPPLACPFQIKNGTLLMHLWLLGRSLGSRPGLHLTAPRPLLLMAGRRRRRRRIRRGDKESPLPPWGRQRQQWMGGRRQHGRDSRAEPEGVAWLIPIGCILLPTLLSYLPSILPCVSKCISFTLTYTLYIFYLTLQGIEHQAM